MPYDYQVTDTKFAGPTCFQRGDTLYINQRGERVALQRSTAIRYQVREAKEKKLFSEPKEPEWTDEQLAELEERKLAFIDQIQTLSHDKRLFDVGERSATSWPSNVLGPHSLASFTTEWRAYPMTTWGATAKGPTTVRAEALGYTKEMAGFEGDRRMERVNPELTDGAYYGPSRGHLQPRWAQHVGMPRGYGYGASMGAWVIDYVAAWAGEWGTVTPLHRAVPQPGLHRRRHLPHRRGGRQARGAQAPAPRRRDRRAAQPGRRGDGQGHGRRRAAVGVGSAAGVADPSVDRRVGHAMGDRVILSTAPLRGPGVDQLRALGELIVDPWIDHQPLRLYDAERAGRAGHGGRRHRPHLRGRPVRGPGVRPARWRPSARPAATPPTSTSPAPPPRGIPVLRAPGRNADAVAELTVGLLLAVTRGLVAADHDVREGEVYRDGSIPYQRFRGWQLAGRTVGPRRARRRRPGHPRGGSRASGCG